MQRGLQLLGVPAQRLDHPRARLELFVLRDVALQQPDLERAVAGGLGQGEVAPALVRGQTEQHHEADSAHPCGQQAPHPATACGRDRRAQPPQHQTAQPGRQHPSQQRRQGPHPVHAHPGRPGTQCIDLGITARAPRETGEPAATRQLGESPRCGEYQSLSAGGTRGPAHRQCGRARIQQAQRPGQRKDRQHRHPRRQAAVGVHGDKQPPEGASQPGPGEQPAAPGGLSPAARGLQGEREQGQRDDLPDTAGLPRGSPGQAPRLRRPGQRSRLQGARTNAQQRPDPAGPARGNAGLADAQGRQRRVGMQVAEQTAHERWAGKRLQRRTDKALNRQRPLPRA